MSFDELCDHVAAVAVVDRSQLSAATRLDGDLLDSIAVLEVLVAMEDTVGQSRGSFSAVETLGEAHGRMSAATGRQLVRVPALHGAGVRAAPRR